MPHRSCRAESIAERAANSLPREPLEDLIQREGIVAELVRVRFEIRKGGRGVLVVTLDRRRLPHPDHASWRDLDLDDLHLGLRPPCDREGLLELEADDPGAQMHADTLGALHAPVAQGIERAPPEREVAGSIPAGRITTRAAKHLAASPSGLWSDRQHVGQRNLAVTANRYTQSSSTRLSSTTRTLRAPDAYT